MSTIAGLDSEYSDLFDRNRTFDSDDLSKIRVQKILENPAIAGSAKIKSAPAPIPYPDDSEMQSVPKLLPLFNSAPQKLHERRFRRQIRPWPRLYRLS